MGEDDGTVVFFDEVDMQDVINEWCKQYEEGVLPSGWYYDCASQTVLVRLLIESEERPMGGLQ